MSAAIKVGDHVWFDGKTTRWLVRGVTDDGRYSLATASFFGEVSYTIIDESAGIRGAMNVIGGGLGIGTTSGSDENIDAALRMLRSCDPDAMCSHEWDEHNYEISHRNRVPLNITRHVTKAGDPQ